MLPTAPELEAMPISCKRSGDGKGDGKVSGVDGSALGEERKANPLARNAVEKDAANMN